jgi:hypothetical protein
MRPQRPRRIRVFLRRENPYLKNTRINELRWGAPGPEFLKYGFGGYSLVLPARIRALVSAAGCPHIPFFSMLCTPVVSTCPRLPGPQRAPNKRLCAPHSAPSTPASAALAPGPQMPCRLTVSIKPALPVTASKLASSTGWTLPPYIGAWHCRLLAMITARGSSCGLEPQTGAVAESPETRQQNAEEAHRAREGSAGPAGKPGGF